MDSFPFGNWFQTAKHWNIPTVDFNTRNHSGSNRHGLVMSGERGSKMPRNNFCSDCFHSSKLPLILLTGWGWWAKIHGWA